MKVKCTPEELQSLLNLVSEILSVLAEGKQPKKTNKLERLMSMLGGLGQLRPEGTAEEAEEAEEAEDNETSTSPVPKSEYRSAYAATSTRGGFVPREVVEENEREDVLSPEENDFLDSSNLLSATRGRDALLELLNSIDMEQKFVPEGTDREINAEVLNVYNAIIGNNYALAEEKLTDISQKYPMSSAGMMAREILVDTKDDGWITRIKEHCQNFLASNERSGFHNQPLWIKPFVQWCKSQDGMTYARRFSGFLAMMKDSGLDNWLTLGQFMQGVLSSCQIQSPWLVR